MKKLFIGCGIAVLLLLGGLGALVWSFWDDIQLLRTQADSAMQRIEAVEAAWPFSAEGLQQLDGERFVRALELRAALVGDLRQAKDQIEELARKADRGDSEVGFMDFFGQMLGAVSGVLPTVAQRLEEGRMGWHEFAWHSRVLWAVLYRVDVGAADAALQPLRGSYTRLRETYEELRKQQRNLPDLRDVLGEFPPAIVAEAEALVARNLDRVQAGLALPDIEHVILAPYTHVDELQLATAPLPTAPPAGADAPK